MWAALAGPAGKILGGLALIIAIFVAGEFHGREAIQQQWDAAIASQAMDAADTVIEAAEETARIEKDLSKHEQIHDERVRVITKERITYVEKEPQHCLVTPEFERVFDRISRLHDPTEDSLPAAADSARATAQSSSAQLADAEILAAYQHAVVQLFALWDTYQALVDWVRTSHEIAKEGAGR